VKSRGHEIRESAIRKTEGPPEVEAVFVVVRKMSYVTRTDPDDGSLHMLLW
jgi:hypothetical protein